MDLGLQNRVALVCAGTAGIGKGIAKGLAKEGCRVAVFSRDPAKVTSAVKDIEAVSQGDVFGFEADMNDFSQVEKGIQDIEKKWGPVEILVHNQAGPAVGSFDLISEDQLNSAVMLNMKAPWLITKRCLPSMKKNRWGRILQILSVSAKEPLDNMILSNMLRPAMLGFGKTLAREIADHGITMNSLLPASVLSERSEGMIRARAQKSGVSFEEALAESEKKIPAGYIASPQEFAQIAVFLCGEPASYVTGSAISVDGGFGRTLF